MKNLPVHTSRNISWDFFRGVVEHSSLVGFGDFMVDSPRGKGFLVESHKTGKRLAFYLLSENSREGEVVSWDFRSACGKFQLHVVND